ncbi:MAG: hypothetical protein EPO24_11225 [Bacteroidetes bacterium]|nr:MAG: hypothetical protein EPO24_11225 [Bacteroidota bacterium]
MISKKTIAAFLLFFAFVGTMGMKVLAQQSANDLMASQAWDMLIKMSETEMEKSSGDIKATHIVNAAYGYYKKGKLLLTAYDFSLNLCSLYYDCRYNAHNTGDVYLDFFHGIVLATKGNEPQAIQKLNAFTKEATDKSFSQKAKIWLGLLYNALGKKGEQEKVWSELDWNDESIALERAAISSIVLKKGDSYSSRKPKDITAQSVVRNVALCLPILTTCSLEEKKKILSNIRIATPSVDNKKGKSYEIYYDPLSLMAASQCALSIGADYLKEYLKTYGVKDKSNQMYAKARFSYAEILFLLGNYDEAKSELQNIQHELSAALLGAVLFQMGDTDGANKRWASVEKEGSRKAQLYLVSLYSMLGTNLVKAEAISNRIGRETTGGNNISQEEYQWLASIFERKKDFQRAVDIYRQGYRIQFDGKIHQKFGNDAIFVLQYANALELLDRNGVFTVNLMLNALRVRYGSFGEILQEQSTSFGACIDPNNSK